MTPHERRIARARLLRREGKTYDEIRAALDVPVSDDRLKVWLRGIPRPAATRRSRGCPELRRECRRLRAQGLTYEEIATKTGASKGSLSLWLRDQRGPKVVRVDRSEHIRRIQPRAVEAHRANALARKLEAQQRGADAVGDLDRKALLAVGVALYWAEGSKDKPWRRSGRVVLINGDADVLRLFLSWLDLVGVAEEDRVYRLNIHESADVAAHERWWAGELRVPLASFARATLKRHKPTTVRRNIGHDYHGCLVVSVRGSAQLYDEIEGAWRRIVKDACSPFTVSDDGPP